MKPRIRIERSHPDDLFSEDDNIVGIDLLESAREFDRQVCEWLENMFPDADVDTHREATLIEGVEYDGDFDFLVSEIRDNVNENSEWLVEEEDDDA